MTISLAHYGRLLGAYLRSQRRRVALLGLLLALTIACELVNPQILRYFIDQAQGRGPMSALTAAALAYLVVALATQSIAVAETYMAENVGWTATNSMRADLALHCLRLDPQFHSRHTPGALIERIDGDVAALGNFFSRFVVQVLGNALLLLGVLILLFTIDWRVGAALSAFALFSLAVANRLRNVATPHWAATRQANADLFGFIEERLSGTEDLRSSGATAYVMRRLHERARALFSVELKAALLGVASGGASRLLFTLGTALAIALGAYLYTAHTASLGTVFLIFTYTQLLSRPIDALTRQLEDLQQAGAGIARVTELFNTHSVIADGPAAALSPGPLSLELRDVSFAYDGPEQPEGGLRWALRDVSFRLEPGTVLGLLGRTGSGKSTLARLLFRLYDPTEGQVLLGGVDLRQGRVADMRARVGMVTQDIQLFHASVRDNLTFFDPHMPDAPILAALREVGLWPWYQALPHGLHTKLAPGGGGISAGEAQLLAFTRAFLQDPHVVVLDEASSRLDPATEGLLEQAMDRLLRGRTAIIIAHRLSTVRRADRIIILEEGRVREDGPRAALAADATSHFAQLLRAGGLQEVLA